MDSQQEVFINDKLQITESTSKLLYFDNILNDKAKFSTEEILFGKPIYLHQIRIVKFESNPHPKVISQGSITQCSPIFNFEIYTRNLELISDTLEKVTSIQTLNNTGVEDIIFPFYSKIITNHIVIRGTFEKITLCIYGQPCSLEEKMLILDNIRNEIPLETVKEQMKVRASEEQFRNFDFPLEQSRFEENLQLLKYYDLTNLILPYLKCETEDKISKVLSLQSPDLNMVDNIETGYINLENEIFEVINYLKGIYEKEETYKYEYSNILQFNKEVSMIKDKENDKENSSFSLFKEHFQKLIDIIHRLIEKNNVFLEDISVFNDGNYEIFNKFCFNGALSYICIKALRGNRFGISEIVYGLRLSRLMISSPNECKTFIDSHGYEALYNLLLSNQLIDQLVNSKHSSFRKANLIEIPSNIKNLVLEIIYFSLSSKYSVEKFLGEYDKSKIIRNYFLISEVGVDKSDYNLIKNYEIYSNQRIDSRQKQKKEKEKEKKDTKNKSRSRSNSNENSEKSKKKRTTYEQLELNNGYQVVLSILLGKKTSNTSSLVQRILNKISFSLYLNEINNLVNYSEDKTCINYTRLAQTIKKIYFYIKNKDIDYLKHESEQDDYWYSKNYKYHHFWNSILKSSHLLFKKLDVDYNTKSNLYINNKRTLICNDIITNELSLLLTDFNLISNFNKLISVFNLNDSHFVNEESIINFSIKTLFSLIINLSGGINFLNKNYDQTLLFLNSLKEKTQSQISQFGELLYEKNFFSMNIDISGNLDFAIQTTDKVNLSSTLIYRSEDIFNCKSKEKRIVDIHFLQLQYFLEAQMKLISKIDDFKSYRLEEIDFIDKSLTLLMYISAKSSGTNIEKQSFISIITNECVIDEIILFLQSIEQSNTLDYEAHIGLLLDIFNNLFTSCISNYKLNSFLCVYGHRLYSLFWKIKSKLDCLYQSLNQEPSLPSFKPKLDAIVNLFFISSEMESSESIHPIMTHINDNLFISIQKYFLNEKLIKDDQFKDEMYEYVKRMKLNILNYSTKDPYFLGNIDKKESLLNSIFIGLRLINISISYNTLILIDTISDYLHLVLKYIIVNGAFSLRFFLSQETVISEKKVKETVDKSESGFDYNYQGVSCIRYLTSILLQIFEICITFSRNLHSSHVDHFRDNIILNNTLDIIVILIDFLSNIYSKNVTETVESEVSEERYYNISDFHISIVEDCQVVLYRAMGFMKEIFKFQTTIKLYFEKIIDKLVSSLENKQGVLVLLNFVLNSVRDEFCLEIFMDNITKHYNKVNHNICSLLDNNFKEQTILVEDIVRDMNVAEYIISIGIETDNNFLSSLSGSLLISILSSSFIVDPVVSNSINDSLIFRIINIIRTSFEQLRNSYAFMEDKEIEEILPSLQSFVKKLKYLTFLLKSELKFLFIIKNSPITDILINSFSYFMDFILSSVFTKNQYRGTNDCYRKMKFLIFDIIILIINCFNLLFDTNVGTANIYIRDIYSINKEYKDKDKVNKKLILLNSYLSEEIPTTKQTVTFISELKKVLEPSDLIKNFFDNKIKKENSFSLNFYFTLTSLSIKTIITIGRTFYGQSILIFNDYVQGKKLPVNPNINIIPLVNLLFNFISSVYSKYEKSGSIQNEKKSIKKSIIKSLNIFSDITKFMHIMFYDLLYYEYLAYKNYDENSISSSNLKGIFSFNKGNKVKIDLSESRAEGIMRIFYKNEPLKDKEKEGFKNKQVKEGLFNSFADLYSNKNSILKISELDKIIYMTRNSGEYITIQSDHSLLKISNPQEIDTKYQNIIKYKDFISTQTLSNSKSLLSICDNTPTINKGSMVSQMANSLSNIELLSKKGLFNLNTYTPAISYINRVNNYSIFPIHDFEKLLNWKKHRIYYSKEYTFNIRKDHFDFDKINSIMKSNTKDIKENDIEKIVLQYIPNSLYSKSVYFYKNNNFVNNDYFQQFANSIIFENYLIYKYSNISKLIESSIHNSDSINSFTNVSINLYSKVNRIKYERYLLHDDIIKEKVKRKISSKLNMFIYHPKYEKIQKNPVPVNFTPAMTYPTNTTTINRETRNSTIGGGRSLSSHVDKYVPNMNVVNTTYESKNEITNNTDIKSNPNTQTNIESIKSEYNPMNPMNIMYSEDKKSNLSNSKAIPNPIVNKNEDTTNTNDIKNVMNPMNPMNIQSQVIINNNSTLNNINKNIPNPYSIYPPSGIPNQNPMFNPNLPNQYSLPFIRAPIPNTNSNYNVNGINNPNFHNISKPINILPQNILIGNSINPMNINNNINNMNIKNNINHPMIRPDNNMRQPNVINQNENMRTIPNTNNETGISYENQTQKEVDNSNPNPSEDILKILKLLNNGFQKNNDLLNQKKDPRNRKKK